ncbi:type I 3-dehydroquinate dehydratase [Dermabacter sp. p3-SID358]|uniref:type I 3-dehydroquinate dehydratase n=1 Tax=Dermabacter sp. p3-SID358 TaxID=2916114 RepID=UPI0021A4DD23|nr:type I 3-dehydroquinate dehydratase [Dermabacter sp. p3-SID358]MCT1866105.1 type I 3-dehydroquinate dehydratase [Dermabacter sp. p3-SID358]
MHTGVMIGEVPLGAQHETAIIAPVLGSTLDDLAVGARVALDAPVDILEVRLDHVLAASHANPARADAVVRAALKAVRQAAPSLPRVATIRTAREGGEWDVSDDVYAELLCTIVDSGLAHAVDVEIARHPAAISSVLNASENQNVPIVLSRHYFASTPPRESMVAMLEYMATLAPANLAIAKLAVMPRTPEDVLALLGAGVEAKKKLEHPLITIAMGRLGMVSRLAGKVFGSDASFATVGPQSAPGQLSARTLASLLER